MDSRRTDLSGQTILGVETERERRDRAGSWPQWVHANIVGGLAMIIRSPRVQAKLAWRAHRRLALGTLAALSVLIGVMVLVDARTIAAMKHLPVRLIVAFDVLSEFGKSGWFLWPIAIALAAVA